MLHSGQDGQQHGGFGEGAAGGHGELSWWGGSAQAGAVSCEPGQPEAPSHGLSRAMQQHGGANECTEETWAEVEAGKERIYPD